MDDDREHAGGKVVAKGAGRSMLVDWTWSSAKAGKGPFRWRMDAGSKVYPAQGTLGGALPAEQTAEADRHAADASDAHPAPVPAPKPVPVTPTTTLVAGLSVSPATITPASDGIGPRHAPSTSR